MLITWLRKLEARQEKKRIAKNRREAAITGKIGGIETALNITEKVTGKRMIVGFSTLDSEQIQAIQEALKEEIVSFLKAQSQLIYGVHCPVNNSMNEIKKGMEGLESINVGFNGDFPTYYEMRTLLAIIEKFQKILNDRKLKTLRKVENLLNSDNGITRKKWRDSCNEKNQKPHGNAAAQKNPRDRPK